MERTPSRGNLAIAGGIAASTSKAPKSLGGCSNETDYDERLTRVPTALASFAPMMSSLSQRLDTVYYSTSAGRSAIITKLANGLGCLAFPWGLRVIRPERGQRASSRRRSQRPCT